MRLLTLLLMAGGALTIDAAFYRPADAKSSLRVNVPVTLLRTDTAMVAVLPHQTEYPRGSLSTTALRSSMKFKNFEMMLDAFRNEPVLVYFTSIACGPCQLQTKELSTVQSVLGVKACKVLTIDTERFPHVGARYSIGKLPCLLFMRDREVLLRLEGLTKAEVLVEHFHAKVDRRP